MKNAAKVFKVLIVVSLVFSQTSFASEVMNSDMKIGEAVSTQALTSLNGCDTVPFVIDIDTSKDFRTGRKVLFNLNLTNLSTFPEIHDVAYYFAVTLAGFTNATVYQDAGVVMSLYARGAKNAIYSQQIILQPGVYDIYGLVTGTTEFGPYSNGWTKTRISVE